MRPKPAMQMTPEIAKKIENECLMARNHIADVRSHLHEAAWLAGQTGNHELDKALIAIKQVIEAGGLLLISLPRLRDNAKRGT